MSGQTPNSENAAAKPQGPPGRGHTEQSQGPRPAPCPHPACSHWVVWEASVSSPAPWADPHPLQGPGALSPGHTASSSCRGRGRVHAGRWHPASQAPGGLAEPEPRRAPPAPAPSRRHCRSHLGVLPSFSVWLIRVVACCKTHVCVDHILCVQPSFWERSGCFRLWLL